MAVTIRRVSSLIPIVALSLLAACGFHLRGAYTLPESIQPIAIEGDAASGIARALRDSLERNGAALASAPEAAATHIVVLDENRQRRVLSVGASAKADEYELRYTVRWKLSRGTGSEASDLIPASTMETRRDYVFDSTGVLAKQNEEETLYDDMRKELAGRIVSRLQAVGSGE